MKPNEMKRFEFWRNVNGGLESSVDEDGKWVRYSDAMQIITALQEKIDGMIKRPTIEVVQDLYLELQVNGVMIYPSVDNATLLLSMKSDLTTALGMDDAKEGGEG